MNDDIRHEFITANGLRFHVAACGDGDRLALCLHGFPECWFSWRYQMPLLARLGYRVWAPDLRGYGETDRPPRMQDYAIEKLIADVAGLIDAASPRETLLVAHDWGAIVAWLFAMRKVRPLQRLVIMNVPHPGASEPAMRTLRQLRKSWYALFFQLPGLPERRSPHAATLPSAKPSAARRSTRSASPTTSSPCTARTRRGREP